MASPSFPEGKVCCCRVLAQSFKELSSGSTSSWRIHARSSSLKFLIWRSMRYNASMRRTASCAALSCLRYTSGKTLSASKKRRRACAIHPT